MTREATVNYTATTRTQPSTQARTAEATPALADLLPSQTYLGPALVVGTGAGGLRVQLTQATDAPIATAQLALNQPYGPVLGDVLLVIGGAGNDFYAIAVITGRGTTELTFQGDVKLHAQGGSLELSGDVDVRIESPKVVLAAGELQTFARSVTEKVDTAYRWIKRRLRVRAGECQRVIEGEDLTRAKSSTTLAEEVVKLDGGSVQLGH